MTGEQWQAGLDSCNRARRAAEEECEALQDRLDAAEHENVLLHDNIVREKTQDARRYARRIKEVQEENDSLSRQLARALGTAKD